MASIPYVIVNLL